MPRGGRPPLELSRSLTRPRARGGAGTAPRPLPPLLRRARVRQAGAHEAEGLGGHAAHATGEGAARVIRAAARRQVTVPHPKAPVSDDLLSQDAVRDSVRERYRGVIGRTTEVAEELYSAEELSLVPQAAVEAA